MKASQLTRRQKQERTVLLRLHEANGTGLRSTEFPFTLQFSALSTLNRLLAECLVRRGSVNSANGCYHVYTITDKGRAALKALPAADRVSS